MAKFQDVRKHFCFKITNVQSYKKLKSRNSDKFLYFCKLLYLQMSKNVFYLMANLPNVQKQPLQLFWSKGSFGPRTKGANPAPLVLGLIWSQNRETTLAPLVLRLIWSQDRGGPFSFFGIKFHLVLRKRSQFGSFGPRAHLVQGQKGRIRLLWSLDSFGPGTEGPLPTL